MIKEFISYEKIAESSSRWHLDRAALQKLKRLRWVVTEKIHGANFCFLTDGEDIRCAKRKAILTEDESFFGYRKVKERLAAKVLSLFQVVQGDHPKAEAIFLYGELFGGKYPHPKVAADPSVELVQTGIYYSPSLEFCAFDLAMLQDGERIILDYDQTMAYLDGVGIFYAEPLLIGSYEEALAYSPAFDSTVPARLGLPPLAEPNPAEGIVVKPLQTVFVETNKGKTRPILKIKIPDFAEDKRFHEVQKPAQSIDSYRSLLDELEWEMLSLLNHNRLNSAVSKVGGKTEAKSSKEALLEELTGDVWESLEEAQTSSLQQISAEEKELLLSLLQDEAQKLITTLS